MKQDLSLVLQTPAEFHCCPEKAVKRAEYFQIVFYESAIVFNRDDKKLDHPAGLDI